MIQLQLMWVSLNTPTQFVLGISKWKSSWMLTPVLWMRQHTTLGCDSYPKLPTLSPEASMLWMRGSTLHSFRFLHVSRCWRSPCSSGPPHLKIVYWWLLLALMYDNLTNSKQSHTESETSVAWQDHIVWLHVCLVSQLGRLLWIPTSIPCLLERCHSLFGRTMTLKLVWGGYKVWSWLLPTTWSIKTSGCHLEYKDQWMLMAYYIFQDVILCYCSLTSFIRPTMKKPHD